MGNYRTVIGQFPTRRCRWSGGGLWSPSLGRIELGGEGVERPWRARGVAGGRRSLFELGLWAVGEAGVAARCVLACEPWLVGQRSFVRGG